MQEIDVLELQKLMSQKAAPRLIDVREQDEWDLCKIPGAELLPLSQWPGILEGRLKDPAEPVYLYCHHGGRSGRATQYLTGAGFTNVTNIAGGIDAWSQQVDPKVPRYD